MQYILPVLMLIVANVFMTLAWYGHLKLQQIGVLKDNTPLYIVILLSWLLALAEYAIQVPANRIGFEGNGGVYTLAQLKIIQEVITLAVFCAYSMIAFGMEIHWNHIAAFICMILAVFFMFWK